MRFLILLLLFLAHSQIIRASAGDSITVYIFLSETCPICQNATQELNSIYDEYSDKGIAFQGVFPNINMSTEETIDSFNAKYAIAYPTQLDDERAPTELLGAKITPEVFVVRNSTREILYAGRINNRYERVGKRRQVVTSHDLRNALDQVLASTPPDPAYVKSVGCFISRL